MTNSSLANVALSDEMLDAIHAALVRVNRAIDRADVRGTSSLIDDLGLDSVRFVELTFALEDVFSLSAFPMDDWAAREMARVDKRFTIASLADQIDGLRAPSGVTPES